MSVIPQDDTAGHGAALARLVHFYETISLTTVRTALGDIYAAQATFKDPFNEVVGLDAIGAIFEHMFEQVEAPRFVVKVSVLQESQAFITWDFLFRIKRSARPEVCVRGATHLAFDEHGKVTMHRDYWDAAEELYEKFPMVGSFMRFLKKIANT